MDLKMENCNTKICYDSQNKTPDDRKQMSVEELLEVKAAEEKS